MPHIFFRLLLTAVFGIALLTAKAQDNTLYPIHEIPQAISLNPAIGYDCRKFIELPVISHLKFALNTNNLSYKDIISKGSGLRIDSFIIDLDKIEGNLQRRNYINLNMNIGLLGFGFSYRNIYYTFNATNKTIGQFDYTKELLTLKDGNWNSATDEPRNFEMDAVRLNATNYFEFAFGASKQYSENLIVGAKIKYLKGAANFRTAKARLSLTTGVQPLTVSYTADYKLRASFPVTLNYDTAGLVNSVQSEITDPVKQFLKNKNRGLAVDFGVIYKQDKITYSASIIDVGFIFWRDYTNMFSTESSFSYAGLNLNNPLPSVFDLLRDSIVNSFTFKNSTQKYMTLLPVKIFGGATYQYTSKIEFAGTARLAIVNKRFMPALTASVVFRPVSFLTLSGSLTAMNNTIKNMGIALALGNNIAQFYFVTDLLPINMVKDVNTGLLFPLQARSYNFRFGINILFGCSKKDRKNNSKNTKTPGEVCPAYRN